MTSAERRTLDTAAEAAGLSTSEWVRLAAAYCVAARIPLHVITAGPLPPGLEVE